MDFYTVSQIFNKVFREADGSLTTKFRNTAQRLNMVLTKDREDNPALAVKIDGLEEGYVAKNTEEVVDDGTVNLPENIFGNLWVSDGVDSGEFEITTNGTVTTVTIVRYSENCINTDSEGYLCVYPSGSNNAVIKNRKGSSKIIKYRLTR